MFKKQTINKPTNSAKKIKTSFHNPNGINVNIVYIVNWASSD